MTERDDFWDIGKLVPNRDSRLTRFSAGPVMTEVGDAADTNRDRSTAQSVPAGAATEELARREAALRFSSRPLRGGEREEVRVYTPADNPLILSVRVRRICGGYSFYEQFRRDALRLFDAPSPPAPYTPFFSFTPQYAQLSPEQAAYYFYFRAAVRRGEYPKTDKGYFFLLVYEIINLPERVPPKEGVGLLCRLWDAYRAALPGTDRYMVAWLTDYCLLHELPCPRELSAACLSAVADSSGFQEFYFGSAAERTPEGVGRLLALSSEYRYENSRAVTPANRAVFARHITGAMDRVFAALSGNGALTLGDRPERLTEKAFAGSLCSHNVRAELTVEYISLRRSLAYRRQVTLAVKYAENRLRAAYGIRARLSSDGLLPEVRAAVDSYFEGMPLPRKKKEDPPAYLRLYDAPETGFSGERAAAIEAGSWETTRLLVRQEEAEDSVSVFSPTEAVPPRQEASAAAVLPMIAPASATVPPDRSAPNDRSAPISSPDPPGRSALNDRSNPIPVAPAEFSSSREAPEEQDLPLGVLAAFLGESAETPAESAKNAKITLPRAVEIINESFLNLAGDILIEPTNDTYTVIPDYREEATEWLRSMKTK